ncbi:MAG: ABC transporter permease [Thermoplasmata archaeon]
MSRLVADLKAFAIQYLRNPVGLFFALIFPILLIMVFGSVFSQTESAEVSLAVQDEDGTPGSAHFIEIMNQTGTLKISMIPPSADIEDYIRENSLAFALVIPEGFNESIDPTTNNGSTPVNVSLYGDPSISTYGVVAGSVGSAATAMNYNLAGASPIIGMNTDDIVSGDFEYIDFFLPGLIGFTIMINALFIQAAISSEYRTRGYFKLLATTPLGKWEWVLSKFLWFLLITLISIAVMFAVSIPLFNVHLTITPMALVIICSGILLFASMGLLIGVWAKDVETASAVANVIGFPMMFLSGTFFPLEIMPDFMQTIAYALPLTYVSEGLKATMVYGNEATALVNLAVVLVLGIIFFVAASKLMRWKEK